MRMAPRFTPFLLGFLALGCHRAEPPPRTPDSPGGASSGAEVGAPGDRRGEAACCADDAIPDAQPVDGPSAPLGVPAPARVAAPDVPTHELGALPPVLRVATEAALEHPVPYQQFPHVPGRVVGVLVMTGRQPYGSPVGHGGDAPFDDEPTDRDEYRFGFEGSSPFAQYFPSRGEGFNYLADWSVPIDAERIFPASAAMFDRETPNPFGLSRRAHLVELEVNGGAGGEGIHFIVTGARVLDGTETFPPRLDALLVALRDDFVGVTDPDATASLAAFQAAREAHPEFRFGRLRSRLALHPTYHAVDRTIDVLFRRELVSTGVGPEQTVESTCPVCPPGAPCMRCEPQPMHVRARVTTTFVVAGRYVVDRTGRVRDRWVSTASTTSRSLGTERVSPVRGAFED